MDSVPHILPGAIHASTANHDFAFTDVPLLIDTMPFQTAVWTVEPAFSGAPTMTLSNQEWSTRNKSEIWPTSKVNETVAIVTSVVTQFAPVTVSTSAPRPLPTNSTLAQNTSSPLKSTNSAQKPKPNTTAFVILGLSLVGMILGAGL